MRERLATPETLPAAAHPNSMGRDEMNLAEFPLATLADRAPRGCKTLVFEDRIWDRGGAQYRVRRLTVSASDKYGLPTALDDEVIVGLVQVSRAAGFAERRVTFSRYQLIQLLGWRDEGRSYRRLEQSLKRWLGVTLYYENAWWDKVRKRWADAHFHLLDDVVLYRRPGRHAGAADKHGDAAPSSFTWNEIVFQSFQAGFLKRLDLDVYRSLKLAVAKRMYRFLDKRFHFSSTLRFNLAVFACEHIGLSRRYDAGQLKRRLNPAIAELERAGYLTPLPAAARYHRLRRGDWEVVFVRAPKLRKVGRPMKPMSDLERGLVERGVTPAAAARLVRQHPAERIQGKMAVFDALRQKGDRRISRNPAGFLVQSIRDDYLPPANLAQQGSGCHAHRASCVNGSGRGSPPNRRPRSRVCHVEGSPVLDYLARLTPSAREELEAKAISGARGLAAEGYRRAMAAGKTELAQHYRQVMVEQYLRDAIPTDANHGSHRVTQELV